MSHLLAFIVTIMVVVAIHEYGHYLAMRLCGVRVLTFSIGFGPRLASWRNRHGTDFAIAAIPLGGFVRPLDRRDGEVPPELAAQEFSGKPAWQRVITYAAGPAANLVLAFFIYWVLLLGGETGRVPELAAPPPDTAAALAGVREGDEILRVDGADTPHWSHVGTALLARAGERGELALEVRRWNGEVRTLRVPLADWVTRQDEHPFEVLGLLPRPAQARVGSVVPDGPAARAGLQVGDRVLTADGEPVAGWEDWVQRVQAAPGRAMTLVVERDGRTLEAVVTPDAVERDGRTVGIVGVGIAGLRELHYGALGAVPEAARRMGDQIGMMLGSIVKLLTGDLSVKTLGGPLTIAQAAGDTAAIGLASFLSFLALLSITLGVINLLPVPMLDGGWIVFGTIEMMTGRNLPERFLMAAQSVGMALVFCLMLLAIYNDIARHFA